jgi:hypothetical protein
MKAFDYKPITIAILLALSTQVAAEEQSDSKEKAKTFVLEKACLQNTT